MKKNIACTGENDGKMKMFRRPKLFDTLSDSASKWGIEAKEVGLTLVFQL